MCSHLVLVDFFYSEATCPVKIGLSDIPCDFDCLYFVILLFFYFFFPSRVSILASTLQSWTGIYILHLEGSPNMAQLNLF